MARGGRNRHSLDLDELLKEIERALEEFSRECQVRAWDRDNRESMVYMIAPRGVSRGGEGEARLQQLHKRA